MERIDVNGKTYNCECYLSVVGGDMEGRVWCLNCQIDVGIRRIMTEGNTA